MRQFPTQRNREFIRPSRELNRTITEVIRLIMESHAGGHFSCDAAKPPLLPAWDLTRQPRSPKRLGHRVAAGGRGIVSARTCLGGSATFFRSRWGDPGGCRGGPRLRGFIEPQRQRDPAAFWVDFQDLDTDDIAGLRNCARVFDVSI